MGFLSTVADRVLGRGHASVTVPSLDGVLKPNNLLEDAARGIEALRPDNAVEFRGDLLFSSGHHVLGRAGTLVEAPAEITAMAVSPEGYLALACVGHGVIVHPNGPERPGRAVANLECVTSIAFEDPNRMVCAVGSSRHPVSDWQRDLLSGGRSGSIVRIDVAGGGRTTVASNLAFPNGVLPDGRGGLLVSESWAKRLVRLDASGRIAGQAAEDLPGYPARLSAASGGGIWLCLFAPRSPLIEFVLRERGYREAMMAEVDPEYWVAPALRSGQSFHEPMQGGALKQMGILKPWAPTRSYGLVVEFGPDFVPLRSFHSRTGGRRHGATSAVEIGGTLWVTSKGGDEVVPVDASQRTD